MWGIRPGSRATQTPFLCRDPGGDTEPLFCVATLGATQTSPHTPFLNRCSSLFCLSPPPRGRAKHTTVEISIYGTCPPRGYCVHTPTLRIRHSLQYYAYRTVYITRRSCPTTPYAEGSSQTCTRVVKEHRWGETRGDKKERGLMILRITTCYTCNARGVARRHVRCSRVKGAAACSHSTAVPARVAAIPTETCCY